MEVFSCESTETLYDRGISKVLKNHKKSMMEVVNELNSAIINGKPKELLEVRIAQSIKEVVSIQEFYKLGLDILSEILDKSDDIDSDNFATIIKSGHEHFGVKASILLPHIKCDKVNNERELENILSSMEFIPVIREVRKCIYEVIEKSREGMKDKDKESEIKRETDDEDEGIDIDWQYEYNKIKDKLEVMEKKISITKQLQFRILPKERNTEGEERERIKKIIKDKDVNEMKEMISNDPSLILGDILHICAWSGWKEGIDLLLDSCILSDSYVDIKENDGFTPLMVSILNEQLEVVKYLIEKGANIEEKDNDGWTPLIFASRHGKLEVVKYLIEKGANVGEKDNNGNTPLSHASANGHLEVVKYLIEKGANIEEKEMDGTTLLMRASKNGYLEIVKYLIEKGANVEEKDNNGTTLLMNASSYGQLEVVKNLIEKGANIEEKNNNGATSLMYASDNGQLEVVKYLIEKGANIEEKDNNRWTALMSASFNGYLEIVKYLIEKGANVEEKDNSGWTALMYASVNDNLEVAEYLNQFIE